MRESPVRRVVVVVLDGLRPDAIPRFGLPNLTACAVATHHNSNHPLDTTIPIFVAGGAVRTGELTPGASLLDVPATVCWALGIPQPMTFAGQPLTSAFTPRALVEAA